MIFIKAAVLLFTLVGSLCAQLPTTTVHVGTLLRLQYGGVNNQQRVSVVAKPGHTLPDTGLGRRARLGGILFAYAAGFDDLPVPTFLPPQNITHWFSLAWTDSVEYTVPPAAAGHNLIFGTPDALLVPSFMFEWLGPSPWDYQQLGVSPPQGWQAYFLKIPIPMNLMLLGSPISVQSYRYDENYKFFISDEAIFVIG
jgi:hypothetical protein